MSQNIRVISSRGTSSYILDSSKMDSWIRNKNTIKIISKNQSGQKLTTMRGTKSAWLTDKPKHDKIKPEKITLSVQRGTKKIMSFLTPHISNKNTDKYPTTETLTCNTCKNKIASDVCRFLITHDRNNAPRFFAFHFFSPCWNFEIFCKKYPNLSLTKAGYSISEDIKMSEKSIKDLQSNLSFWI